MAVELICLDMDGVIFQDENFWMNLHKAFGTFEEGKILTEQYLKTDYAKLVEEVVVKLWSGRDATPYVNLVNSIPYNEGISEFFDYTVSQGIQIAIISASSLDVARRVQRQYQVDHIYANHLVVAEGKVTGEFHWPVGIGAHDKARIVR